MIEMLLRVFNKMTMLYHSFLAKIYAERMIVLMMHHVGEPCYGELNVSEYYFELLLRKMERKNVVSLKDLDYASMIKERNNVKWALTFDDVPDSFYYKAFPLLKKYNIPFTLFVATSLLDKKGFLTRTQLVEISKSPLCTIGSHGVSHSFVRNMPRGKFIQELIESKRILRKMVADEIMLYAFPYGSFYACGFLGKKYVLDYYRLGFSTIPIPILKRGMYPHFLPRINVTEKYIDSIKISR